MHAVAFAALLATASAAAAPPNAALLVAKPSILDPNFSHTVVLVTRTPEAETVGVILNRPTHLTADEVLPPELPSGNYHDRIYFGGPVRVSSPSRDDLQTVMRQIKEKDFGVELNFGNYRTN